MTKTLDDNSPAPGKSPLLWSGTSGLLSQCTNPVNQQEGDGKYVRRISPSDGMMARELVYFVRRRFELGDISLLLNDKENLSWEAKDERRKLK